MIPREKLTEVASQLLTKTRDHQVRWFPDMGVENGFVTFLPQSRMRVALEPVGARIAFVLQNNGDHVVGELSANPAEPAHAMLRKLHEAAAEASTRWDEVLREVEAAVRP